MPRTLADAIDVMCRQHPKLPHLLDILQRHLLKENVAEKEKVLIDVEDLAIQYGLEMYLKLLGFNVAVIHAGMSTVERDSIANEFNSKQDIDVLLTTYAMCGIGVDFHLGCSVIVLYTRFVNLSSLLKSNSEGELSESARSNNLAYIDW